MISVKGKFVRPALTQNDVQRESAPRGAGGAVFLDVGSLKKTQLAAGGAVPLLPQMRRRVPRVRGMMASRLTASAAYCCGVKEKELLRPARSQCPGTHALLTTSLTAKK